MNLTKILSLTSEIPELSSQPLGVGEIISDHLDAVYESAKNPGYENSWFSGGSHQPLQESAVIGTPAMDMTMEKAKLKAKLIQDLIIVGHAEFVAVKLLTQAETSPLYRKNRDVTRDTEAQLPVTPSVFIKEIDYF